MSDHKSLYNILQIIRLLHQPGGYDVDRLANRFDVTNRSIYRYFSLLRDLGFELEKRGDRYRFKIRSDAQTLLPLFSDVEIETLKSSVLAWHASNPLRESLIQKLNVFTDADFVAEIIEDHITAQIIKEVISAIREKKQIILKDYSSPSSHTIRDRHIEPIGFSSNLRYFYAWEPVLKAVRQFKPERVRSVEVTENVFQLQNYHNITAVDSFGMNSRPIIKVTLLLKQRARHLLSEEFPEVNPLPDSRNDITKISLTVHGFEGVGRFVLGLPGEIDVLSPKSFISYLQEQNQSHSWK